MKEFSIERAKNKQFYAKFNGYNGKLVWDTLPDRYTRKAKAIKAVCVIAKYFGWETIDILDNTTPGLPIVKTYDVANVLLKA